MKVESEINREVVIALAGITELEYNSFLFETAHLYLDIVLVSDEEDRKCLLEAPAFWRWWTRQWNNREQALLASFVDEKVKPAHPVLNELDEEAELSFYTRWRMRHAIVNLLNIQPNRFAMRVVCGHFKKKTKNDTAKERNKKALVMAGRTAGDYS